MAPAFLRVPCVVLLFSAFFAPAALEVPPTIDEMDLTGYWRSEESRRDYLTIPEINSPLVDTFQLVEGDILRPLKNDEEEETLQGRSAVFRGARLWPYNASSGHYDVPYELSKDYDEPHVQAIQHVFEYIAMGSNVRFVPRANSGDTDFISILPKSGCWSALGRQGGAQEMSLGLKCIRFGTIAHQVMHTLGMGHVHQRRDRDDHIFIRPEKVEPTKVDLFAIQDTLDSGVCTPYDLASITHFEATAFHKDGATGADEITIVPLKSEGKVPLLCEKLALSSCDWYTVNLLYPIGGFRFECLPDLLPATAVPKYDCESPSVELNCDEWCWRYPYSHHCELPPSGFPDLPTNVPNKVAMPDYTFDPSRCGSGAFGNFTNEWPTGTPSTTPTTATPAFTTSVNINDRTSKEENKREEENDSAAKEATLLRWAMCLVPVGLAARL